MARVGGYIGDQPSITHGSPAGDRPRGHLGVCSTPEVPAWWEELGVSWHVFVCLGAAVLPGLMVMNRSSGWQRASAAIHSAPRYLTCP